MKKTALLLSLSTAILFSNAATKISKSTFVAKIDGVKFDIKKSSNYTAQLSADGKTATVTFYGNDIYDQQGKAHAQKLNVEYALNENSATVKSVVLEYNEQKFVNVAGTEAPVVSKVEWNNDKTGLTLSANFDCQIQKPQTSEMFEGIIGIQGNIENVKVNVTPSDVATITE